MGREEGMCLWGGVCRRVEGERPGWRVSVEGGGWSVERGGWKVST